MKHLMRLRRRYLFECSFGASAEVSLACGRMGGRRSYLAGGPIRSLAPGRPRRLARDHESERCDPTRYFGVRVGIPLTQVFEWRRMLTLTPPLQR